MTPPASVETLEDVTLCTTSRIFTQTADATTVEYVCSFFLV
jgi:hypothetical protein